MLSVREPYAGKVRKKKIAYYCDDWLYLKKSQVKESTYTKYLSIVENHIKPGLGDCIIQNLSTSQIETYSRELIHKEHLSSKSVRDILTVLQAILKYSRKIDPYQIPAVEVSYPREGKKEIRVLSKEEQFCFMKYLTADMDACKFGILLALLTGLRIGEICALRWQDINLEEKMLCVSATMQRIKDLEDKSGQKTKVIISSPKSDSALRIIPLTDYTEELCRRFALPDPKCYILTGRADRYMEPRTLQYRLKHYIKDCGLENVHFHVLRHTFATRCIEVGFEIKSLSEILGHTSPRFTLDRYVHSSMELKRSNMSKLAAIENFLSSSNSAVKTK